MTIESNVFELSIPAFHQLNILLENGEAGTASKRHTLDLPAETILPGGTRTLLVASPRIFSNQVAASHFLRPKVSEARDPAKNFAKGVRFKNKQGEIVWLCMASSTEQ